MHPQVHRDEGTASVVISAPQAFAAHASPVTVAEFSPSGDRLITCDGTGVVLLWSNLAAPEQEAWELPPAAAAAAAAAAAVMGAVAAAIKGEKVGTVQTTVGAGAEGGAFSGGEGGGRDRGQERRFGRENGDGDLESELGAAATEAEEAKEAAAVATATMDSDLMAVPGGAREGGGGRVSLHPGGTASKVPWFLDEAEEDRLDGEGHDGQREEDDEVVGKSEEELAAAVAGAVAASDLTPVPQGGTRDRRSKEFASISDQTPPPGIALVKVGAISRRWDV